MSTSVEVEQKLSRGDAKWENKTAKAIQPISNEAKALIKHESSGASRPRTREAKGSSMTPAALRTKEIGVEADVKH